MEARTGWRILFMGMIITALSIGCQDPIEEPIDTPLDLTTIAYDPVSMEIDVPDHYPEMPIPADNPTTEAGVILGQHLFYDPILSKDSSMACVSCHLPEKNWTDGAAVSTGVDGLTTSRSSMSLFNVGFYDKGLFWDGRSPNLEHQALLPIEDPIEFNTTWQEVMARLRQHDDYPRLFRQAFGITDTDGMNKELAAKALAQFQRLITASGSSKYDRWQAGTYFPDDLEFRGFQHFFDVSDDFNQMECGHCHNEPLFTTNDFFNNGLQSAATLDDFADKGQGEVIGNRAKNGFMRTPTLYNIALSAPYMHDGSIGNLDDVIEHYVSGGHFSPNKDALIDDVSLDPVTDRDRQALKAFIEMLVDTAYLDNPYLVNPWD
jgi:cytochrome c peroxidase